MWLRLVKPILIISLLICCSVLSGNLRRDFSDAEQVYRRGEINEFASLLLKLKPINDEERAYILYYSAVMDKDTKEMTGKLEQLVKTLPQTYYAQLGHLLLAQTAILDRRMEDAQANLRKITHADITERLYWQAFCSLQINDLPAAITNAESYLRLSPQGALIEEAHYLITDAYLRQKKYSSAVSTLKKLQALSDYPRDQQYFHFKLGYAYEQQSMTKDALLSFEQGYKLNKFSQLAYQIEDRLFEMKSRFNSVVDLGFLYDYSDLAIVREIQQGDNEVKPPDPSVKPVVFPTELKLPAKPKSGMYLQAGRLSSEQNTVKLVNQIRGLGQAGVYYEEMHNNKLTWVVLCGPFNQRSEADNARALLIDNGIECFVTILK
ncbi:MAG: SPOR domain-containing protein [Candidatus Cloacimonetes bacterium]|nr:SPOR domain-containing protein [Candidatus Cloacimonadota bacterium]